MLAKSVLSKRGTVQVDPRTNTLIISDLPESLDAATDAASRRSTSRSRRWRSRRASSRRPSRIARALGVQWGVTGRVDPALGNTTNLAFPNSGSVAGRTSGVQGPAAPGLGGQSAASARQRAPSGLALGSRQRRVQPRRRALRARVVGQRPDAVDAARVDAEQRRSRNRRRASRSRYQTISNNTVTTSPSRMRRSR